VSTRTVTCVSYQSDTPEQYDIADDAKCNDAEPARSKSCPLLTRPCSDHGSCVRRFTSFGHCECRTGYTGDKCENEPQVASAAVSLPGGAGIVPPGDTVLVSWDATGAMDMVRLLLISDDWAFPLYVKSRVSAASEQADALVTAGIAGGTYRMRIWFGPETYTDSPPFTVADACAYKSCGKHGSCNKGKCECLAGYKGEDCSIEPDAACPLACTNGGRPNADCTECQCSARGYFGPSCSCRFVTVQFTLNNVVVAGTSSSATWLAMPSVAAQFKRALASDIAATFDFMETDQIVVRSLKAAGLKGVTVELELREQCASVRGQAEPDGDSDAFAWSAALRAEVNNDDSALYRGVVTASLNKDTYQSSDQNDGVTPSDSSGSSVNTGVIAGPVAVAVAAVAVGCFCAVRKCRRDDKNQNDGTEMSARSASSHPGPKQPSQPAPPAPVPASMPLPTSQASQPQPQSEYPPGYQPYAGGPNIAPQIASPPYYSPAQQPVSQQQPHHPHPQAPHYVQTQPVQQQQPPPAYFASPAHEQMNQPAPTARIAPPAAGLLPAGWAMFYTPEGQPYYHHAATGTTQWEPPY